MDERLNDYDWAQVFGDDLPAGEYGRVTVENPWTTATVTPGDDTPNHKFTRGDVAEILHIEDGEHDGPDWIAVVKLKDGRYAALEGGCDYTGWDCQSDASRHVASSYEDIVRFGLTDSARKRFGLSLDERSSE